MKKVLLSTSAIALAGAFASTASAAEWDVRVGGYMEQYLAYAHSNVDNVNPGVNEDGAGNWGDNYDGVDNKSDTEIWFIPSITLDNGIKIGANVQLEGNTSGDQIDESYMFIQGAFGEVDMGSENSAGYKMTYAAPDVTFVNVNSGSLTAFIPFSGTASGYDTGADVFRGTLGTTFVENGRNNDAQRFTYYTPRFAGFQVGASYARDAQEDSNTQLELDSYGGLKNIFDVGANYVNSFGDIDVAVSGRWGTADSNVQGEDPRVWGAGLNLGYAGFTVGGSFAEQNGTTAQDGTAYDAGVSYETGPWGFSFTYFNGKNADNENSGFGIGDPSEQLKQYLIGVNYTLAKGVNLGAFGAYVDFNEDASDGTSIGENVTTGGDNVDGFVIGTGVKISF